MAITLTESAARHGLRFSGAGLLRILCPATSSTFRWLFFAERP